MRYLYNAGTMREMLMEARLRDDFILWAWLRRVFKRSYYVSTPGMKDLADYIDQPGHDIEMGSVNTYRGRVHCAAGWQIYRGRSGADLDLNFFQMYALFMPSGVGRNFPRAVQKRKLLQVLRGQRPLTRKWLIAE